jgi:hypothetical protein
MEITEQDNGLSPKKLTAYFLMVNKITFWEKSVNDKVGNQTQ